MTLRSDKEASIIALEMAIAVRRKAETALIESPVRESQSNGHADVQFELGRTSIGP